MVYANSADPDQTAPKEQSDQGLHSLPFHQVFRETTAKNKAKFSPYAILLDTLVYEILGPLPYCKNN